MVDFNAVFQVATDIMTDLPDFESTFDIGSQVITSIEQGHMPTLTPDQIAQFKKDVADIKQIIADIKALA